MNTKLLAIFAYIGIIAGIGAFISGLIFVEPSKRYEIIATAGIALSAISAAFLIFAANNRN